MKFLIAFLILVSIPMAHAGHLKGVYGDDNRRLVKEAGMFEQQLSRSVLAQVPFYKLQSSDIDTITFEVKAPMEVLNLCSTEKFSFETMLSSCTGFLVAKDLLLTAGHCIKEKSDCEKNMWILDYNDSTSIFNKNNIVYCKEIVDSNAASDYTLIRLSKPITDRIPLKIRRTGKLNPNAEFVVIGHPLGLPKIITDQAFLRGNLQNRTFTISSDTYSGNSGSPVIDKKTLLVEGILIKGDRDFEMDYTTSCKNSVHCDYDTCKGETVLRSASIPTAILH